LLLNLDGVRNNRSAKRCSFGEGRERQFVPFDLTVFTFHDIQADFMPLQMAASTVSLRIVLKRCFKFETFERKTAVS
jgi:hypothetical protein